MLPHLFSFGRIGADKNSSPTKSEIMIGDFFLVNVKFSPPHPLSPSQAVSAYTTSSIVIIVIPVAITAIFSTIILKDDIVSIYALDSPTIKRLNTPNVITNENTS